MKPDQIAILIGQQYKLAKKDPHSGENQYSKSGDGKNYHQQTTAETIAKQHGISEKTVRNAEKFVDAVEDLKEVAPKLQE